METITVGILGIAGLLVLLATGMPIGIAMSVVGVIGFGALASMDAAIGLFGIVPYATCASYTLSVLPLFILMGEFAFRSGLSSELFTAFHRWIGFLPGGLAMASVAGCAGFGAICGTSPATAATMGTIAIPEMKKYRYSPSLATGAVAAGGTLGIMIPPSMGFIMYGVVTENSIVKLFTAGMLPGILLASMFCGTIWYIVRKDPGKGPAGPRFTIKEKMAVLKLTWGIIALFVIMIGGMLIGLFTATEGAAVGAFGSLLFMIGKRKMSWKNLSLALLETGKVASMVFVIMIGAYLFGYFLTATKIPVFVTGVLTGLPLPPTMVLICILVFYMFLGCIMDALAMIVLTVPIFYPTVIALGYDPIWFGVLIVVIMEQALITPPVGMNCYIIAGVDPETPLEKIFTGIGPFWVTMLIFVVILILFPQIPLLLPNLIH
ncbi:MAG: TRAP transporter large permease [Dehalobacterium sp.]